MISIEILRVIRTATRVEYSFNICQLEIRVCKRLIRCHFVKDVCIEQCFLDKMENDFRGPFVAFTNHIVLAGDGIIFVYETHTTVVVHHQLFFEDSLTITVEFRGCHRLWGVKR